MTPPPLVKCEKCGTVGAKERMTEEGNHHKRACALYRPYLLVHCKSCGVGGGPAWIMTSGRHHGWSCPRYSSSTAGACKFCAFVGEVSMVKNSGPQHVQGCPRFARGNADSPKVAVCRYCGFRDAAESVTGIGDQHSATCPRSPSRAAAAKKGTEGASPFGWSLMACFCCGVDTTSEIQEIDVPAEVPKVADKDPAPGVDAEAEDSLQLPVEAVPGPVV